MRKLRKISSDVLFTLPSQIIPPTWANPIRGEARLESIGSFKSCIRFGRSQNSDVQLIHENNSWCHSIIYHHPNGSCHVIKYGYVYCTYVVGTRVEQQSYIHVIREYPTYSHSCWADIIYVLNDIISLGITFIM